MLQGWIQPNLVSDTDYQMYTGIGMKFDNAELFNLIDDRMATFTGSPFTY